MVNVESSIVDNNYVPLQRLILLKHIEKMIEILDTSISSVGFRTLTLAEQIANELKKKILTGSLRGGDQLLEDRLKNEFRISRTPLREALRVLEKEGLVDLVPRKGSFVRKISRKDIEDAFPIRATLEGLAARLAYESKIEPATLNEMSNAYVKMQEAVPADDFIQYTKLHFRFHELLINSCQNESLINILRNLRTPIIWHRYEFHYNKANFENSLQIHFHILDLLKQKTVSPETIEEVVRRHIEALKQPFLEMNETIESE